MYRTSMHRHRSKPEEGTRIDLEFETAEGTEMVVAAVETAVETEEKVEVGGSGTRRSAV